MFLKGLSGGIYKPLNPKDIDSIHNASLTILERTGLAYESGLEEVADMLEGAGAPVDRDKKRITFPSKLIRDQIKKAPAEVVLYSRDGENDLKLADDHVYLGTGGAALRILDMDTGKVRSTTLNDLHQIGRLVDKLDNINFLVRPCIPTDIPGEAYDENMFYACLRATGKHVMSGLTSAANVSKVIDMAVFLAGSREELQKKPFISGITSFAISPLKLSTQAVLIMQELNRNMIPVALSCAPMAGSTSPITMAGTLALIHAEQMAGIAICQLTRPEAPVLYGGIPGRANLRTMGYSGGSVECGMMNAAIHQMANHIKVPNYNSAGLSDSKFPDAQAAMEKSITILLASMGGSNYIHHSAGMLESMLTVAYEQYVIDNEILGMSCKVLKGISVDERHLALDVIDSVGPGGEFMTADHTLEFMRDEYYESSTLNGEKWLFGIRLDDMADATFKARAIARNILAQEEESYIPEAIDRKLREQLNILL
jgi:trimethylamine---corrinoid protein Co-methyltransferase